MKGLINDDGAYTTDTESMAALLTKHWGDVLSKKPIDQAGLQEWLAEVTEQLPADNDERWILSKEHVEKAIKFAHETAPGIDGIPYKAFKKFPGSAEILYRAATHLLDERCSPPIGFNFAVLCCLPKKPVKCDPDHGDVYDAAHTR